MYSSAPHAIAMHQRVRKITNSLPNQQTASTITPPRGILPISVTVGIQSDSQGTIVHQPSNPTARQHRTAGPSHDYGTRHIGRMRSSLLGVHPSPSDRHHYHLGEAIGAPQRGRTRPLGISISIPLHTGDRGYCLGGERLSYPLSEITK